MRWSQAGKIAWTYAVRALNRGNRIVLAQQNTSNLLAISFALSSSANARHVTPIPARYECH